MPERLSCDDRGEDEERSRRPLGGTTGSGDAWAGSSRDVMWARESADTAAYPCRRCAPRRKQPARTASSPPHHGGGLPAYPRGLGKTVRGDCFLAPPHPGGWACKPIRVPPGKQSAGTVPSCHRTPANGLASPSACPRENSPQGLFPHATAPRRMGLQAHPRAPGKTVRRDCFLFRGHPMCRPPLTEKSAPVAKPDSSDATHDTMDAMSSGVPRRLTGMPATILSSTSWRMALTMSVAM